MGCYYCGHAEDLHLIDGCHYEEVNVDERTVMPCQCAAMAPICEHDIVRKKAFENAYYCVKCDVPMNVRAVAPSPKITSAQLDEIQGILKKQLDDDLDRLLSPAAKAVIERIQKERAAR